jgi:hypothetical protein
LIGSDDLWLRLKGWGPGRTAREGVRRVRKRLWFFDEIRIMKKNIVRLPVHRSLEVVTHHDVQQIMELNRATGHATTEHRVRLRLQHGLHFYASMVRGTPVATTWIVPQGQRFFDECGYALRIPADDLWIRDIHVAPWLKGRRVFSAFLDHIVKAYHPAVHHLWSDIEADTAASLRAHRNYGFEPVCTLKVLHVAECLMLRTLPSSPARCADGFKVPARVLATGPRYKTYTAARLM